MPRRALALACLLGVAVASGAEAANRKTVLGSQGELYSIEQRLYGDIAGPSGGPEDAYPVLALRIRRPEQPDELHVLPPTVGPDVENAPALLYEEASETLFVAWEARFNLIHSQVLLVGYSDGTWGEPLDVSDTRFSLKHDPRLAVTRDEFEGVDLDGESAMVRRTVVHAIWVEERAEGLEVVYSPLALLDGTSPGPSPIYVLSEMLEPEPEQVLPVPLVELPLAPAIATGHVDHSVVVAFVHPRSGRLVTASVALLPADVSALADGLRAHIINTGYEHDTQNPGQLTALADGLRAHIINTGHRLEPGVLSYVGDDLRAHIINTGRDYDLSDPEDVRAFAGTLRAHIINTGVRLEERGVRLRSATASPLVLDFQPSEETVSHQLRLAAVSSRALEGLEAEGEPVVLVSAYGGETLVAWATPDRLRYQESRGEGWSAPRALSLSTFPLEQALEIVEHRARNR